MSQKITAIQPIQKTYGAMQRQFATPPSVITKVMLVWARNRSELYQRLSFNITREVCCYLHEPVTVFTATDRYMCQFDVVTKQFSQLFEITCFIGWGLIQSSALIGPSQVFMTLKDKKDIQESFFAIYSEGVVREITREDGWSGCRVIYDKDRDCVYIFGGETRSYSVSTQFSARCRKFLPATNAFETLPEMLRGRSRFGVCWHFGLVYLCGGSHCSVDTFDPRTLMFSDHSVLDYDLNAQRMFVAVSHRSEVIVISKSFLWTERDGDWEETQRNNLEGKEMSNIGSSIVWNDVVYLGCFGGCIGVDLKSGQETAYEDRWLM